MCAKQSKLPACATCDLEWNKRICMYPDGVGSAGCPTLSPEGEQVLAQANQEYADPTVHNFARQASIQEAACYANRHQRPYVMQPTKTRIVEICEFAQRMGYNRIGLAFCVGLANEAGLAAGIFASHGLEVVSVVCKAGRSSKEEHLGLSDEQKIFQGTDESMCNPIYQAKLLDEAGSELNVLLGLCVGHDSLFLQYAKAPCTILAVKDRVTGHNPLAALYTSGSYYRKLNTPGL